MRFAIAAIVAAGLATTPAAAQDANQANMADPTETVGPVDTMPDNAAVQPGTDEPLALEPAAPVLDPSLDPDVAQARRDSRGFPWGLLGLIGLVGLLGRRRS